MNGPLDSKLVDKKIPRKQSVGVMQVRLWQGIMSLFSMGDTDNGLYELKLNTTKTPSKGRAELLLRGALADGRHRPIKST